MTTVFLREKACSVCGNKERYPQTGSSPAIRGAKDLDGRPTQIQRSSVYIGVQRCAQCGYCASDITKGMSREDRLLVENELYQNQLTNERFPESANAYLCKAMFDEKNQLFVEAGFSALYAAWVCDDNGFSESAVWCRQKALACFGKARKAKERFCNTKSEENLLLVDLLRRNSEFNGALTCCEEAISDTHNEYVKPLLHFERDLIRNKDAGCHNDTEFENYYE